MTLRGLVSAQAPHQSVSISANGCRVASASFDMKQGVTTQTVLGTIPVTCIKLDGSVVLVIDTDRILTPSEIGVNSDQRRLGVGVEKIVLRD
jgi:sensor domain CHASE-containing protein